MSKYNKKRQAYARDGRSLISTSRLTKNQHLAQCYKIYKRNLLSYLQKDATAVSDNASSSTIGVSVPNPMKSPENPNTVADDGVMTKLDTCDLHPYQNKVPSDSLLENVNAEMYKEMIAKNSLCKTVANEGKTTQIHLDYLYQFNS